MKTLIIFDLDDTLVSKRALVPRQTYHMLNKFKKLGYIIGVISYNCLLPFVANNTNLYKYTNSLFWGDSDRNTLFKKCLQKLIQENQVSEYRVFYVDDRLDHLENIKGCYSHVLTYHCLNPLELYKFKNEFSVTLTC